MWLALLWNIKSPFPFKQNKFRLWLALFSAEPVRVIAEIFRSLGSTELSLAHPPGSLLVGLCLDTNFRTISKDFLNGPDDVPNKWNLLDSSSYHDNYLNGVKSTQFLIYKEQKQHFGFRYFQELELSLYTWPLNDSDLVDASHSSNIS